MKAIEYVQKPYRRIALSQAQKRQLSEKTKGTLRAWIVPVIVLIIWEIASRLGWVLSYQLPAPTVVFEEGMTLFTEGLLVNHIGYTLFRVLVGFLIGSGVAILLSVLLTVHPVMTDLFDPIIQGLRAIPSLAWVPLFILWMGIGESSKIALISLGVFFPVYLNVAASILTVDRKLVEVGEVFRFSKREKITKILIPYTLPQLFTGLRTGLGLGWMFVVAAELMGASVGLGYLLVLGQNTLSPETILVSILLFLIIGKITDGFLKALERRLVFWQH